MPVENRESALVGESRLVSTLARGGSSSRSSIVWREIESSRIEPSLWIEGCDGMMDSPSIGRLISRGIRERIIE